MDYQKDTTGDKIKDIQKMNAKSLAGVSLFDNTFFDAASKRTEKIVTALYMVSDFIKDNEPIKYELRSAGLALLGKTYDISKNGGVLFKVNLGEVLSTSKKLISFLEVAATLSLVSNMNYQILRNELMALGGNYESKLDSFGVDIRSIIGEEKQPVKEETSLPKKTENTFTPGAFYKGHIKDIFNKGQSSFTEKTVNVLKYKGQGVVKSDTNESTDTDERKNKIISIIKSKISATIGEISVDIKNVSDKTIQRDLQSLIDKGVVERTGERRWSKYSLRS